MKSALTLFVFINIATHCFAQQPLPAVLPQVTVEGNSGACPAADEIDQAKANVKTEIRSALNETVVPQLNRRSQCPCGGPGDWTRIAHLNMSDPAQQCPPNWNLINTPVRGCGRGSASCESATFPSSGRSHSRVCGRINAYQRGSTDAFDSSSYIRGAFDIQNPGLEDPYLDGVSLTHGTAGSRRHIWSFASALSETGTFVTVNQFSVCACTTNTVWPFQVPSFVGSSYFCDTGNPGPTDFDFLTVYDFSTVYADDPLWDGEGCGPTNTCCELNNPPWFCTTLPQPTTDDLELRICSDHSSTDEAVIVSFVDINVM